jgi:hypothetical protein
MGCANSGMQYIVRMRIIENSLLNVDSVGNRHWVATQKCQLVLVICIIFQSHILFSWVTQLLLVLE